MKKFVKFAGAVHLRNTNVALYDEGDEARYLAIPETTKGSIGPGRRLPRECFECALSASALNALIEELTGSPALPWNHD